MNKVNVKVTKGKYLPSPHPREMLDQVKTSCGYPQPGGSQQESSMFNEWESTSATPQGSASWGNAFRARTWQFTTGHKSSDQGRPARAQACPKARRV